MDCSFFWDFIAQVKEAYDVHRKRIMKRYELSSVEVDVLLFIANNPKLNTASQIARLRKMAKSHVSLAVNSLASRGFLERVRDTSNRKVIHLLPAPAAAEMIRYSQAEQEAFVRNIERGISQEEDEAFRSYLVAISNNISNIYDTASTVEF